MGALDSIVALSAVGAAVLWLAWRFTMMKAPAPRVVVKGALGRAMRKR